MIHTNQWGDSEEQVWKQQLMETKPQEWLIKTFGLALFLSHQLCVLPYVLIACHVSLLVWMMD